jgi:hypothetical protein
MSSKECCKQLLSNSEIEKTYDNSNKLNLYDYKYNGVEIFPTCNNKNIKNVTLDIKKDDIVISELVERTYLNSEKLMSCNKSARVACHKFFIIKDKYKGGIAKELHNSECKIYSENKIKEIHLHAIDDGVVVWLRLGFIIVSNNSLQIVYEKFMEYLENIKNLSDNELDIINNSFMNNDLSINIKAFKKTDIEHYFYHKDKREDILNFTNWFQDNIDSNQFDKSEDDKPAIKMYKEVPC